MDRREKDFVSFLIVLSFEIYFSMDRDKNLASLFYRSRKLEIKVFENKIGKNTKICSRRSNRVPEQKRGLNPSVTLDI